jgi:hypothetical protein
MLQQFTQRGRRCRAAVTGALVVVILPVVAGRAHAAGSAYVVDTSDVNPVGWCKYDMWYQRAGNGDLAAVANPDCVFDFGRPVELNAQVTRSRSSGDWSTSIAPKAKTNIIPSEIGSFGVGISVQPTYDGITGQNTALAVNVPVTLPFSKTFRFNINGGWNWDRTVDQQYLTYGFGLDWRTRDNVHMLTMEIFGQAGARQDPSTVITPRFQAGLRWRPVDQFSVDMIYGRNINGENANWITFAVTFRTPSQGSSPGVE